MTRKRTKTDYDVEIVVRVRVAMNDSEMSDEPRPTEDAKCVPLQAVFTAVRKGLPVGTELLTAQYVSATPVPHSTRKQSQP